MARNGARRLANLVLAYFRREIWGRLTIPGLRYDDGFARPPVTASFHLPRISSASGQRCGLAGRRPLPARNRRPADCKLDFQTPIRAEPVLEQGQSARYQTK